MNGKNSDSEEKSKKDKSESEDLKSKDENSNSDKSNDGEQLINYYSYINDCSTKIEENRQNYFNKLSELKSQIENVKTKSITSIDYIMLILSEFVTLSETYYSSFAQQKKILEKFNELNDSAQNINFCYEKANYSNLYYKESNRKLNKQYKELYNEHQNLKEILNEIKKLQEQKKAQEIENEIYEINEQNEMKNKMDKVLEENIELKKRCSQILSESKIIKNFADDTYEKEQENNRRLSTLLNKIDIYEEKIDKMQRKITEYENERINTENKESEIINNTSPNINNKYENENTINLENKSELSDNLSIRQGINLEDLLENQNDMEEEDKKSKNIKLNVNNNEKDKNIDNKSNYSSSFRRYNEYDIDADIDEGPKILKLCPIKKKNIKTKHERNVIHIYNTPFSFMAHTKSESISKSQSPLTKKIKNESAKSENNLGNLNKSYYKIFFFLLLKSIIINKKIKEFFKKNDFDALFDECERGRIPFNKYEDWINNKFNLNGNTNDKNLELYMNEMVNDCFICSSMI